MLKYYVRDTLREILFKIAVSKRQIAIAFLVVQLKLLSSTIDKNLQRWYHCWVRILFDDHLDPTEIIEAKLWVLESDMTKQVQVFYQIWVQIVKVPP